MLSLSWIWLLTGICSVVIGILMVPAIFRVLGADSDFPPELTVVVIAVTFCVIGLLYVLLPGLYVLFYRSPHVAATCRARHPDPQWFDVCPRRVLTLTVVWFLAAISVLLMPAYDFFFPIFGAVLTGAAGAVMWALVLGLCVALTVGSLRRSPWAWWTGMGLTIFAALSSVLTVLRHDLSEIMVLMDLPADQISMVAASGIPEGWPMALVTAFVWGSFVVYLTALRRFFLPASDAVDE